MRSVLVTCLILCCTNLYSASLGTWNERDPGANESVMGVAYGNGLWVIVGTHGYIASSPDGETWKKHSAGIDRQFNGVTSQKGRFIAVCKAPDEGSGAKIWVSDNGKSWKYRDSDSAGNYLTEGLHAVAGDGGSALVAVGGGYSGKMTISKDNGETWSVKYLSGVSKLYGVAYGGGVWVACGSGSPIRSTDGGSTWKTINGGPSGRGIAYGNGSFVIAASDGLYWSNDQGVTWKGGVPAKDFTSDSFGKGRGVAYGDGYFAAAFEDDGIWMSETGVTWQKWTAPGNNPYYYCMGFGNKSFMAGGDQSVGSEYPAILAQSPLWFRAKTGAPGDFPYTAFDFEDSIPRKIGLPEYRVNTSSLNLVLEATLFYMRTLCVPVNMKLVYCSSPVENGDKNIGLFGKNWRFRYESSVGQYGTEAQLISSGGRVLTFTTPNGEDLDSATTSKPIVLDAPPGVFDTLTFYGDYFEYFISSAKITHKYATSIDYVWKLTSITDRSDNVITISVDSDNGKINSIKGPAGRVVTLNYDGSLCAGFTTPDGRTVTISYDADKNLTGIVDMAGYKGVYEYDELGFMTEMTTAGRKNTFTYAARPGFNESSEKLKNQPDANDQILSSITNSMGKSTTYEPLENGDGVQRTDPIGNKTVMKSDNGLTTQVTDPLGKVRGISYNSLNLPETYTDANKSITNYEYDERGNPTRITDAMGNVSSFTYDNSDNLLTRKNELGYTWQYSYDAKSRVSSMKTPLASEYTFSYSANGRLASFSDALLNVTSFSYDAYGNLENVKDPKGNSLSLAFANSGLHCATITDPRGNIKNLSYDNNDRLLQTIYDSVTGTPKVVNVFDAFGQTSLTDELGKQTTATRNDFGFIKSMVDPMGNVKTFEYNPDNKLIKAVNALGNVKQTSYDADSRPLTSTDPSGKTITRTYDDNGNIIGIEDKNGGKTTFEYDANNQPKSRQDPLGNKKTLSYDLTGKIEEVTNARNQRTKYSYDADGRLVKKEFDEGSGSFSEDVAYTYDANGNVTNAKDNWGSTNYVYDSVSNVTSISYPTGKSLAFTYDSAGGVSSVTYPNGVVVSCAYDKFNRIPAPKLYRNASNAEISYADKKSNAITEIEMVDTSGSLGKISMAYDYAANLTELSYPNGVTCSYSYDENQRVISITHLKGDENLLSMNYLYDSGSNVIKENFSGEAYLNPTMPETIKFAYDVAGQISKAGKNGGVYDADGNLTSLGDSLSAKYDPDNRITKLTENSETFTYTYDGKGQRVKSVSSGGTTINYHYDHLGRMLFTSDSSGSLINCYIYANQMLVAVIDKNKSLAFYHGDRAGNVRFLSNGSGTVTQSYAYSPYGLLNASTEVDNPFTYCGILGVMRETANIYYMRQRFYNGSTGAFLQRDPIGFKGGINLYLYAKGNPIGNADPNGTEIITLLTAGKLILMGFSAAGLYFGGKKIEAVIKGGQARVKRQELAVKRIRRYGDTPGATAKFLHLSRTKYNEDVRDGVDAGLSYGKSAIVESAKTVAGAYVGTQVSDTADNAFAIGLDTVHGAAERVGDFAPQAPTGAQNPVIKTNGVEIPEEPALEHMDVLDWDSIED